MREMPTSKPLFPVKQPTERDHSSKLGKDHEKSASSKRQQPLKSEKRSVTAKSTHLKTSKIKKEPKVIEPSSKSPAKSGRHSSGSQAKSSSSGPRKTDITKPSAITESPDTKSSVTRPPQRARREYV